MSIEDINLFVSLLGWQAQIGPICNRALCNILKKEVKDKRKVTLQDEGEELLRWVSTKDINLEGKVKDKGNIICKSW
jgi:hypothetical protein